MSMPPKRKKKGSSGVVTRSAAKMLKSQRRNRKSSGRSVPMESSNQQGDIVDMFNRFKDVFGDESQENEMEMEDSTSSASGSESEKSDQSSDGGRNEVARSSRTDDVPPWARQLIENQQKAIRKNDKKLDDLREEIRALKRKRNKDDDEDFEWKKKGHKKQFEFNRSLENQFQEIASTNDLLTARVAAEKGLELINERNKLLKIADSHGWDTVNQYVADPLAANEQDDRKLRKAIKDAEKAREKAKSEKEAKSRRFARAKAFTKESALSPARLGPPVMGNNQRIVLPTVDKKTSRLNCFRCGKPGHMIRDCTNQSSGSSSTSHL